MRFLLAILLFLSCVIACEAPPSATDSSSLAFQPVEIPGSGRREFPQLFSKDERLYMSWLEERTDSSFLKLTYLEDGVWSEERTVAKGEDWFVNWADFPEIFVGEEGTMFMHHLAKTGNDTYAYGVEVSQKKSEEDAFRALGNPYQDSSETEHGFVSFFSVKGEGNAMLWLDGRKYASGNKEMSLRTAKIDPSGTFYEEAEIDGRTCDCCQTDAASTTSGAIVVYRDRSEGEIRDIYRSIYKGGVWSEPKVVAEDNWEINGCPVNGPVVSTSGDQVVVAWLTAANDTPRVKVAFSTDGGETFGQALQIDQGNPMGRVDAIWGDNGQAYISWMERGAEKKAEVMIRKIHPEGKIEAPQVVGEMSGARASGFPIMVQHADNIYLAWTLDQEVPDVVLWSTKK